MNEYDMKEGRDLDALIAKKYLKYNVLDERPVAIFVEGEWSIHVDSEGTDGWACHAEYAPVYSKPNCTCSPEYPEWMDAATLTKDWLVDEWKKEWKEDIERFGHDRHCLEVVPEFSTDIRFAMSLLKDLDEKLWPEVGRMYPTDKGWYCEICEGGDQPRFVKRIARRVASTASLAICQAILEMVRYYER